MDQQKSSMYWPAQLGQASPALSDVDFAKAGEDLASWVFEEDDLYKLDFCFGAKESHSLPLDTVEDCGIVPYSENDIFHLINNDLKIINSSSMGKQIVKEPKVAFQQQKEFQDSSIYIIDECMDPNDIIKQEIFQQQRQQQLEFFQQQEEIEASSQQLELNNSLDFSEGLFQVSASQSHGYVQQPYLSPTYSIDFSAFDEPKKCVQAASVVPLPQEDQSHHSIPQAVTQHQTVLADAPNEHAVQVEPVTFTVPLQSAGNQVYEVVMEPANVEKQVINVEQESIPAKFRHTQQGKLSSVAISKTKSKQLLKYDHEDEFDKLIKDLINSAVENEPQQYISTDSPAEQHHGIVEVASSHSDVSDDESEVSYVIEEINEGQEVSVEVLSPSSADEYDMMSDDGSVTSTTYCERTGRKNVRTSPYSLQERKLRKKEQNKQAALRYRLKKKQEEESVLTVLQREEQRQKVLSAKYDEISLEVKMLKKLLGELINKKKSQRRM